MTNSYITSVRSAYYHCFGDEQIEMRILIMAQICPSNKWNLMNKAQILLGLKFMHFSHSNVSLPQICFHKDLLRAGYIEDPISKNESYRRSPNIYPKSQSIPSIERKRNA